VAADGVATLEASSLPPGEDSVVASYAGDRSAAASTSNPAVLNISEAASSTTIGVSEQTITYGQPITLTAIVQGSGTGCAAPTGTVSFLYGTQTLGSATLDASGTATLTIDSLPPGATTFTASYSGDGNYFGSTAATVVPANFVVTTGGDVVAVQDAWGNYNVSNSISFSDPNPGASIWSAAIAVGGSTIATYTYGSAGTYDINYGWCPTSSPSLDGWVTVTVTDDLGASGTATFNVTTS
jgi:hypothetical protein